MNAHLSFRPWILAPRGFCQAAPEAGSPSRRKAVRLLSFNKGQEAHTIEFHFQGKISWFPGHMAKATKVMKSQLKTCDLVLELRDARLPFTTANPMLDELLGNKPRMIVYNKADLANRRSNEQVRRYHEIMTPDTPVLFTSVLQSRNLEPIIKWATQNAHQKFKTAGALIMVSGMPNVGKSTLINSFRRRSQVSSSSTKDKQVAKVGDKPGVTRHVSSIKVSDKPLVYLMDTPGIMFPRVKHPEMGLKLALTGALSEKIVEETLLVEYMLHCIHKARIQRFYMRELKMKKIATNIEELLERVLRPSGGSGKNVDTAQAMACQYILKLFREGRFGKITLDDTTSIVPKLSRQESNQL